MISNGAGASQSTVSDSRAKAFRDRPGGPILIMTAIALTVISAMAGVSIDGGNRPVKPGISVDDILIETEPGGTGFPYRIEVRRSGYESASSSGTPTRFENRAVTLLTLMG